jgi:hypothetical protein
MSVIGPSEDVAGKTRGQPSALAQLADWGPVPGLAALLAGIIAWALFYALDISGFWLAVTIIAIGPAVLLLFGLVLRPADRLAGIWPRKS